MRLPVVSGSQNEVDVKELAKGNLRTLIRDAGLTVQEFVDLF